MPQLRQKYVALANSQTGDDNFKNTCFIAEVAIVRHPSKAFHEQSRLGRVLVCSHLSRGWVNLYHNRVRDISLECGYIYNHSNIINFTSSASIGAIKEIEGLPMILLSKQASILDANWRSTTSTLLRGCSISCVRESPRIIETLDLMRLPRIS